MHLQRPEPGPASIGWQGATPTGSNTANFVNNTPGTYPVTCTVNGVAVATTTVTVQGPESRRDDPRSRTPRRGVESELA